MECQVTGRATKVLCQTSAQTPAVLFPRKLPVIVTAGPWNDVWHKNVVVFISRRNEFPSMPAYIKKQSDNIMKDFRACLNESVVSYLDARDSLLPWAPTPPPVSLTQVADCVSGEFAPRGPLGARPRGIFISQKNTPPSPSISANFARECGGLRAGSACVAPEQSFGQGHIIAHAYYIYEFAARRERDDARSPVKILLCGEPTC